VDSLRGRIGIEEGRTKRLRLMGKRRGGRAGRKPCFSACEAMSYKIRGAIRRGSPVSRMSQADKNLNPMLAGKNAIRVAAIGMVGRFGRFGEPGGLRSHDPLIKSQMLYH
jgi:hypothetical protein